jgi:hypothetical protein
MLLEKLELLRSASTKEPLCDRSDSFALGPLVNCHEMYDCWVTRKAIYHLASE